MNRKKVVFTVFGTRPECIKMSILCKKLNNIENIQHFVVSTGQHKQMLNQVIDLFDLKIDFDLEVMRDGQDLTDVFNRISVGIKPLLLEYRPDLVLVHGDTITAFATSLVCFYLGIPVGHVEAGLRTHNFSSPFPEESNRVFISKIAKFHFAPTALNVENLKLEGIINKVFQTGNTVIDSLFFVAGKVNGLSNAIPLELKDIITHDAKIILVTGHRRENFGEGFLQICEAIKMIAIKNPDVIVVYPVHLNPNVMEPVYRILSGIKNVMLIEPLGYKDFVFFMKRAFLILTDSGGVQEEAPSFGVPVLVMRDTTERPEAVSAGTVRLVGAQSDKIIFEAQRLIDDSEEYNRMSKSSNPYGDGKSVDRIVEIIIKELLS
jgi:UDP-N-acetylglucosamine 2-epimerase (non-hydrolysing)